MNTIFLIGMMGSGKTTVGEQLSLELKLPFFDIDKIVEEKNGKTINDIFIQDGESKFREWEASELQLLKNKNGVISCGGGIVLSEANRKILKTGVVVFLNAPITTLLNRLKHSDNRPLLKIENMKTTLEALLEKRHPLYEATANIIIKVDHLTSEDCVRLIKNALVK